MARRCSHYKHRQSCLLSSVCLGVGRRQVHISVCNYLTRVLFSAAGFALLLQGLLIPLLILPTQEQCFLSRETGEKINHFPGKMSSSAQSAGPERELLMEPGNGVVLTNQQLSSEVCAPCVSWQLSRKTSGSRSPGS